MRVAITGSSGLIGTELHRRLDAAGHSVLPVVRGDPQSPASTWSPATGWFRPGALQGVDAVVHLAGESIGSGRWSDSRRRALVSSRTETTRLLVSQLASLEKPPAFVSASAIGYYGDRADEPLDETAHRGAGFLANLTEAWEKEASRAAEHGAPTALLRFGIVLSRQGGALPRMLRPFRLGAGGRLGNGRQWMSWITLDDAVSATMHVLERRFAGVFNVASPSPVTNREFTRTLGRVLHRPALFPAPAFALRLLLGPSADELLLSSQRVVPARLQESGFEFEHPHLEPALRAVLEKARS
ncbi:MAG: TIGR01777 family protein [Dehalococcoidia bacterium]|nr:TIGR01777 family protein [Chloroflexi bacterium CFX7]MCK6564648.1 TIGR01777 family oxidoreductase [Dehalococcoidia bacterium]NUQ56239.1 TIGR01777 family protein [Dehalococcoidia bacterium]RIL02761.1 MAG: TIGR01777 family protein [bacterium]